MTLREFLDSPEGVVFKDAHWARLCGIGRAYFSQLAAGKRAPSLEQALLIDTVTEGKVTPYDWKDVLQSKRT